MVQQDPNAVKIFLGSSRKDTRDLRDQLWKHLAAIRTNSHVDLYPSDISAGLPRNREIRQSLDRADIILLLISPDLIASNDYEVNRALERYNAQEKIRIIPILLVPVNLNNTPLSIFLPLPKDRRPVAGPSDNAKFVDIAKGVEEAINDVYKLKVDNWHKKLKYVNTAKADHENGNYQAALNNYKDALKIDPYDASLYEALGDIKFELQHLESALALYETAYKTALAQASKPSGRLLGKKGRTLFSLGKLLEAKKTYYQAIQDDLYNAELFSAQGDVLLALTDTTHAIAAYERACELEPMNALFLIKVGDTYLKQAILKNTNLKEAIRNANLTQAITFYERAYELEPSNALFSVKLGDAYFYLSPPNYLKAIANYEQAIKLQPEDASTHKSKAKVQLALARTSSTTTPYYNVLSTYKTIINLDTNDPDSYKEIGDIFLHIQQLDRAREAYEQAIRLKPDFSQAFRGLGDVFHKKADEMENRSNK